MGIFHTITGEQYSGDCGLHLDILSEKLSNCITPGSNVRARPGRLHLQWPSQLEKQQSEVQYMYTKFEEGYEVVRGGAEDRLGLQLDLTTEQVIMRAMKTNSGLAAVSLKI